MSISRRQDYSSRCGTDLWFKRVRILCQTRGDGLLPHLFHLRTVGTIVAITTLVAVPTAAKALAVQLQTLGLFAVARSLRGHLC